MSDAARQGEVVDWAEYLREALAELDETIAEMRSSILDLEARRTKLAVRLAVIDAATSPEVEAAVADYERRASGNRPYEDAEDASTLLGEAHRRFGH